MVHDLVPDPDPAMLRELAERWGIAVVGFRPDLIPAGSPERTIFRAVIADEGDGLFVLERISPQNRRIKMRILRSLEYLARKGMHGIVPYVSGRDGRYIQEFGGGLWQLAPFVRGVALDRERYLHDEWRGDVLAEFLIELRDRSRELPFFSGEAPFSLKKYIQTLVLRVEEHRPDIFPRVRRTLAFLETNFMDVHDEFPLGFNHGDYHPLNIIWGADDLKAVIDWEFAGMKPEIYDVANMVGCLGMEHPSSLAGGLAVSFIRAMRDRGGFAERSWTCFSDFVVALRFAWLSEWLRKDDAEMVALELDYMDLLIEHRDRLRSL